jgi:SAM-dependent methyltransferase
LRTRTISVGRGARRLDRGIQLTSGLTLLKPRDARLLIPEDLPPGRFDLLVASEVLYYLTSAELDATVEWAGSALRSGGRVVCVHWLRPGPERPLSAEAVHARFADARTLIWTNSASTDDYLLDSFERR